MDELGRDETFMQYLTAPVHSPGMNLAHTDLSSGSATTPHQLAVNKLYPLAFIRLLEAQARFAAQTELADRETEAADEKHRYDDPVDDDMPAMRGRSGAAFDMRSRFRSVGGNCIENGTQVTPKEVKSRAPENMMRLIRNRRGNANETEGRGDTNHLFQPIDGDCRNMAFVPVC